MIVQNSEIMLFSHAVNTLQSVTCFRLADVSDLYYSLNTAEPHPQQAGGLQIQSLIGG